MAAALGDGATAVPLDVVFGAKAPGPGVREPVGTGRQTDPHSFEVLGYPYVATPELLALYGIDPASVDPTTELLTRLDGDVTLLDIAKDPRDFSPPSTVIQRVVELPKFSSAPNSLVTPAAVERNGWKRARSGWIVESAHPLTAAQRHAAHDAAVAAGLAVEVRTQDDGVTTLRTGATAVGALLALAIVAMAVGLVRGEAASEVRTLTATGAAPHAPSADGQHRRRSSRVPGVLLGTAGAYIALIAAFHTDLGQLTPVPLDNLVVLVVGIPVVATAAGWLLAGHEPTSFARQALD